MKNNLILINNPYNFNNHDIEIWKYNIFKNLEFTNRYFLSKNIDNIKTNYDYTHCIPNCVDIVSHNSLNKYLNSCNNTNSLSNNIQPTITINNAVLFYCLTTYHDFLPHMILDFFPQLHYYYDILKKNEDLHIIIEYIGYTTTKSEAKKRFITYIREIGLKNNICFISNKYIEQEYYNNNNILKWDGILYVKKLCCLSIQNSKYEYAPLLFRYVLDNNNKLFIEKLNDIINQQQLSTYNCLNIHFKTYGKKFLILEHSINRTMNRGYTNQEWNSIHKNCLSYCNSNNLHLFIWNKEVIQMNSIYNQQVICNNADIIIAYGGSFSLFKISNNCSKILIIDCVAEVENIETIRLMSLYNYIQHSYCTKLYLCFREQNINKIEIINNFLTDMI